MEDTSAALPKTDDGSVDNVSIYNHEDFLQDSVLHTLSDHGLTVLLTGTRSSGKTHLLRALLQRLAPIRKIDHAMLISATAHTQFDDMAYSYVAPSLRFEQLAEITRILETQRRVVEHNKKLKRMHDSHSSGVKNSRPDYVVSRIALVLDDFSGMSARNNKLITSLCTHGRHLTFKDGAETIVRTDSFFLVSFLLFL